MSAPPASTQFSLAVLLASLALAPAGAGVISTTAVTSGNWSAPDTWSTNPDIPNNGQPDETSTYAVTMNNKVLTLDTDVVITNFTMGHISGASNALTNPGPTPTMLAIQNLFGYTQGIISGNTTVKVGPGGTMIFLPTPVGQTKQLNATLVNEGIVTIEFLTTLQSTGVGSKLVNAAGGVMNVSNGLTLSKQAGSVDPIMTNEPDATINVLGGATFNWRMENNGLVNASGNVTLNGGGEHEGEFVIAPNRSVTFGGSGQTHTLLEDSVLSGAGTASYSTTANVHTAPANYTVEKTQVNPGGFVSYFGPPEGDAHELCQLNMNGGTLAGAELDVKLLNWLGGLIDVLDLFIGENGAWVVPPFSGSQPRMLSGLIHNQGEASLKGEFTADSSKRTAGVVNTGTIVATDDLSFLGEGTLENDGLLKTAAATTSIDWKTIFGDDSQLEVTPGAALFVLKAKLIKGFLKVDENGRLDLVNDDGQEALAMALIGASMFSNGAANFLGSSLGLKEPVTFDADSQIGGSGRFTVDGRFIFNNKTSPGNSPGTLTIEADELEMGETHRLEMELGAPGSAEVDLLAVEGDLVLDGVLDVIPLDGFGSGEYVLITCTGAIADEGLEFGAFPAGFQGSIEIDASTVRLIVTETSNCAGDVNGDGEVSGADLGILLIQFGATGSADLDGNGIVNGADLGILLNAWGPC